MKLFWVKKSKILGARTYIFEGSSGEYHFISFFRGKKERSKDRRTACQCHGAFSVSVTITGYNSRHFRSH